MMDKIDNLLQEDGYPKMLPLFLVLLWALLWAIPATTTSLWFLVIGFTPALLYMGYAFLQMDKLSKEIREIRSGRG